MEFRYSREERLKEAPSAVQEGQEKRGQKGLFRRNPSLRITLWDLSIILFVVVVLVPLLRWAGSHSDSGVYQMSLDSFLNEDKVLVSLEVILDGKASEPPPEVEVRFFLDGQPAGDPVIDIAPSLPDKPRIFRVTLPYQGQSNLKAVVLVGEEESLLSREID